ncbi:hypothetical protein [Salininema proteolyticum]|uniref:Polyhydroxyalkanoic acid system protein n=1 Tax=Salininema proteolyticum TaxID=1607685 RepID=A0ABV8TTG0_9ACTN
MTNTLDHSNNLGSVDLLGFVELDVTRDDHDTGTLSFKGVATNVKVGTWERHPNATVTLQLNPEVLTATFGALPDLEVQIADLLRSAAPAA